MKFLIVSYVPHKKEDNEFYAYGPYVREMNIWLKNVDVVKIVAPFSEKNIDAIELAYQHSNIEFVRIPELNFTSIKLAIKSFFLIPIILIRLFSAMQWSDHIHLRCPGNIGLLGAVMQIFFPAKQKTIKYASNWDWAIWQPLSYRIQQKIIRSEFLSRNTRVLVYGDWNDKTNNMLSFFTASFSETLNLPTELNHVGKEKLIRLLFVGALLDGKRPFASIMVCQRLIEKGYSVVMDFIGGGTEKSLLESYIEKNQLGNVIRFHGKIDPEEVIEFYKKSHFLVFLSRSEGWPKVVAEAMWWGCLPITTNVSCVSSMLGNGTRGCIVSPDPDVVAGKIEEYILDDTRYTDQCKAAMEWSREFTLEKFESEVRKLVI